MVGHLLHPCRNKVALKADRPTLGMSAATRTTCVSGGTGSGTEASTAVGLKRRAGARVGLAVGVAAFLSALILLLSPQSADGCCKG